MKTIRILACLASIGVLAMAACGGSSQPQQPDPGKPGPGDPLPFPTSDQKAPPIDPSIFPEPGETEFITANESELLSTGTSPGNSYGRGVNATDALASEDGKAGGADPSAPAPTPSVPEPEPIPDVTREIVEADVYKVEGDLLYVLNRYRGLVIIDVKDPDQMYIRGRLPFQAMPVEMYVRDGRAYIVSSDYFQYWQYDPEADPHGFHGSQVMIADVSNADQPKQIGALHVDGEVTDTRMVGDVLYTVSKRRPDYWRYNAADWEDTTWIVSLNVADPANIKEIDRITFSGTSTLLHVAHHAIFVAAWDPNFYLTSPTLEQETLVTYVDISEPSGKLRKRGTVYIPGQIADKFKMDWFDGHLRVLSQQWQYNPGDEIKLNVISTAHPDTLKIDTMLAINGVTRSGLQATRFAEDKAFAFTSEWNSSYQERVQKLHTIDLGQPLSPKVAGQFEVDIDSTHIEVHGDRILVLGSHYDYARYNSQHRVAVALYDVSALDAVKPLALQLLGEGYARSEANADYKAFKSFPQIGLILVPLSYWNNNKSFTGVQLVDWANDTLTQRGRVANTGGVTRAFPVGNRVVAIGEMAVVTIDVTNRDLPAVTKELRLVHHVHDVFDVQGQQVQLVTDVYTQQVRFEVRQFGPDDDSATIATLDLPFSGAPFVLRDGDVFHLLGYETGRGQVVRNAIFTDPKNPKLAGDLLLSDDNWTVYNSGWGWYHYYWSPSAGLPLRNQIVAATFREVVETASGRRDWNSELRFLDLRDVNNPRVATGKVPMNDYPFVNKITHGNVLYSTHVEQATSPDGASLLYHVRSFVDRVDVTDPDNPKALPSVNIPGYLVDVSDDGKLWYTVDFQWDAFGRRRNSINVLKQISDDTVQLISVLPVADQINRAALRPGQLSENGGRPTGWNDRTIWLTAHKYPWWGVHSDTVTSRQPYTVLQRVDFDQDGAIAADLRTSLEGYHFNLLDIEQSKVYLGTSNPYGMLVLDTTNMAKPQILHTARTLGYVSRIVVNGNHAYAPLGMYGLHRY